MKIILVQPPQWIPTTPHLAIPLLTAQLKKHGHDAFAYDMNVKFFNRILTNEVATEAEKQARKILSEVESEMADVDVEQLAKSGTLEQKTQYLRRDKIKNFLNKNKEFLPTLTGGLNDAVQIIKSKDDFYTPEKLVKAKHIIRTALQLISLPYAPNELDFNNYFCNPLLNLDWENIKFQVKSEKYNMFLPFVKETVAMIKERKFDAVSISLTDLSQLIPVFTFCRELKKTTDVKIILGGNYATQIHEDIMQFKEIFTDYIDFLTIGDGEISFVKLCDYLDGNCDKDDLSNLVCYSKEQDEVISTGFTCEKIDMNKLAFADFSDYDFSDYFTSEPVFDIQVGKGCYWGKCKFCDYYYGQQKYAPKTPERLVEEITYYVKNYNAKCFNFVDEAIPPAYYNKIAKTIIKSGLKIYYYSFARLEDGYTKEVFDNLYRSGARIFLWGYECESLRVMKLMNKGINAENRLEILQRGRNAGIWNVGLFIFGYPTETREEIQMTMDVINNNRYIIPSITLSNFALKKHSVLQNSVGKDGIIEYKSGGEFYTVYKDTVDGIEHLDRRAIRRNFQFDFLEKHKHELWSVVFSDFEHLLLYLSKYGIDYVQSYRSEENVSPEFR